MHFCRLVGLLSDPSFHKAKFALENLHRNQRGEFESPSCKGLLEYQWTQFLLDLRKEQGGEMWGFDEKTVIYCDDWVVGSCDDLISWAADKYNYEDFRPSAFYKALAREALRTYIASEKKDFVYMDISIGEKPSERVVFELFRDLCPKTCANFVSLCTGKKGTSLTGTHLSYADTLLHRVVKNGWIQGGDVCSGSGAGGESIYGLTFEDECFAVGHNSSGVLGMANHGRNTNNSQFYVTLKPCPWMDKIYVAFGRMVEGTAVLQEMENVHTYNERPVVPCKVTRCGLWKMAE